MNKKKKTNKTYKEFFIPVVLVIWGIIVFIHVSRADLIDLFMVGGYFSLIRIAAISTIYVPIICQILIFIGRKIYEKDHQKLIIYIISLIILVILSIVGYFVSLKLEDYASLKVPSKVELLDRATAVVHKDKVYYLDDVELNGAKYLTRLMSIDEENNNKLVCDKVGDYFTESESMKFVYNNEIYFYYNGTFRKINIETCKQENVGNYYEKIIMNQNFGKDYYYTMKENPENAVFTKYDFVNKQFLDKKLIEGSLRNNYIIDYDNFIIYNGDFSKYSEYYYLKKDYRLLYSPSSHIDLLTLTKNYIIASTKPSIYIINVNNPSDIESLPNTFENSHLIESDNNDKYFQGDNAIYQYDEEKKEFTKTFDLSDEYVLDINYSYHINNKVVFFGIAFEESDYSESLVEKMSPIVIYDLDTKEKETIENVITYNYDDQDFYIYNGKIHKVE